MANTELITTQTVGGNVDFGPFAIEYIDITDIKVSLDGVLQTLTTQYSIDSATSTVTFVTAPDTGAVIRIFRETPIETAKAILAPGSSIRAQNLNDNTEQALFAIQEIKSQFVTESNGEFVTDVDLNDNRITNLANPVDPQDAVTKQYLEDNYFDDDTETILSSEVWPDNDVTIATTAAIDNRVDAKIDSAITGDIGTDGTGITITNDGDGTITLGLGAGSIDFDRIKDVDIITSAEAWNSSDTQVATTQAIDDYVDTAITNDIGVDATGLTLTDDGDGTITLGIGANSVDLDRIKDGDIISLAEQDAGSPAPADTNIFTASAAAKRFDTLVQLGTPSGSDYQVGKTWLQNDDDLTLSIWNGTGWTAVSSGGTFTEQPSVIYVDQASGDDANTGHRISTPKATIKAAIEQINAEIGTEITSGGSGYVTGSYSAVPLTGGNGTGLTADITVAAGVVTSVTVNSTATLENYSIGDVLSANNADLGGSGSGLQITVNGDGDGQIVIVSAGAYPEAAPIQIKRRNVSIIGQSLRSCIVHPTSATETNTLFELNSGSYISNLTLTGVKAGTGTGNTLDAVLPTTQGWNFAFYDDAFITKSPYIQNCTNFSDSEIENNPASPNYLVHNPAGGQAGDTDSAPTGGGLLVNGATPHDNSPLRSMVCDSYTHVGLNGPGILVTNNGYLQATSSYAFFNRYHIKCLNGGQANLAASTTDFGTQALVADGKSTTNIITSTVNGNFLSGVDTFTINAPTADASWHGTSTRPQTNMLVTVNSVTYPILSAVANGSGWDVEISRPDPTNRSNNLGLNGNISDGAAVQFFLRSQIASSGHTMEYVGSGTNYLALPENGGVPIEANQVVESNNGKIWTATTDHNGKFKVGDFFEVDQQLGFVTIPEGSIAFDLLSDQSPQLGANLDVNGQSITSASNGNIVLNPDGTGVIDLNAPTAVTGDFGVTGNSVLGGQVFLENGTAAAPTLAWGATNQDTGIYSPGEDQVAISTGGTGRLFVDASGDVGIHKSSPIASLDVETAADQDVLRLRNNDGNDTRLKFANQAAGLAEIWYQGDFRFVDDENSDTERLRIDSSGRVGVGTSSPGAPLTVSNSGNNKLTLTGGTNQNGLTFDGANGSDSYYIYTSSLGLNFYNTTDSVSALTIDNSNRVGVGTTSPIQRLQINGNTLISNNNYHYGYNSDGAQTSLIGISSGNSVVVGQNNVNHVNTIVHGGTGSINLHTSGTERARIDNSGRLLVGTNITRSNIAGTAQDVVFERANIVSQSLVANQNASGGSTLSLCLSRGTAVGSNTIVQSGDIVGTLAFRGNDGTNFLNLGSIKGEVDGTPGSNDMPGRLVFSTTADGASSPTERVRIQSDGKTKFSGGVYGNETTITASDFDLNDGNFFTCGAIAIPNPTNGVAGMSGLIRVTAAPTSFGSNWDFPGGSYTAPTAFPAVAPFYIVSSTQFYLGNWTEGIA